MITAKKLYYSEVNKLLTSRPEQTSEHTIAQKIILEILKEHKKLLLNYNIYLITSNDTFKIYKFFAKIIKYRPAIFHSLIVISIDDDYIFLNPSFTHIKLYKIQCEKFEVLKNIFRNSDFKWLEIDKDKINLSQPKKSWYFIYFQKFVSIFFPCVAFCAKILNLNHKIFFTPQALIDEMQKLNILKHNNLKEKDLIALKQS